MDIFGRRRTVGPVITMEMLELGVVVVELSIVRHYSRHACLHNVGTCNTEELVAAPPGTSSPQ